MPGEKLIARVTDVVKHGTTTSGAIIPAGNCVKTFVEGLLAAKNGGSATCSGAGDSHSPGTFAIIATSTTVIFESQPVARDQDTLTCGAVIQAGSTKSSAG